MRIPSFHWLTATCMEMRITLDSEALLSDADLWLTALKPASSEPNLFLALSPSAPQKRSLTAPPFPSALQLGPNLREIRPNNAEIMWMCRLLASFPPQFSASVCRMPQCCHYSCSLSFFLVHPEGGFSPRGVPRPLATVLKTLSVVSALPSSNSPLLATQNPGSSHNNPV